MGWAGGHRCPSFWAARRGGDQPLPGGPKLKSVPRGFKMAGVGWEDTRFLLFCFFNHSVTIRLLQKGPKHSGEPPQAPQGFCVWVRLAD